MSGEAQKVCLQSGGGSNKFSILIFPIYQPPLPINNDHSLIEYNFSSVLKLIYSPLYFSQTEQGNLGNYMQLLVEKEAVH
jgi:hypothetical protein